MESLNPKAIVQAIREAAATAAASFPSEAEICNHPRHGDLLVAVCDSIRPLVASLTIAGAYRVQRTLAESFNENSGPDHSAFHVGTWVAMTVLDEFGGTATAATIDDAQARLAWFIEGEEEDWLANRLWNPYTANLARDLQRIKTGELGKPVAGTTFGEFTPIRKTEGATA